MNDNEGSTTLALVALQAACLSLSRRARKLMTERMDFLRTKTGPNSIIANLEIEELEHACRKTGHSGFEWNPYYMDHIGCYLEATRTGKESDATDVNFGSRPYITWAEEYEVCKANCREAAKTLGRQFDTWREWKSDNGPVLKAAGRFLGLHRNAKEALRRYEEEAGLNGWELPIWGEGLPKY